MSPELTLEQIRRKWEERIEDRKLPLSRAVSLGVSISHSTEKAQRHSPWVTPGLIGSQSNSAELEPAKVSCLWLRRGLGLPHFPGPCGRPLRPQHHWQAHPSSERPRLRRCWHGHPASPQMASHQRKVMWAFLALWLMREINVQKQGKNLAEIKGKKIQKISTTIAFY